MPKSKRDKKVSLTKTNKKGLVQKQQVIEEIQSCAEKYDNIFLFSAENMRNSKLKEIRTQWRDSRFVFGKNNIMKLGLEKSEVDEQFVARLEGQCGLLFTPNSKEVVLEWFNDYSADDFARSGFKATKTVILPTGPLEDFSHAIEPHLRKLGMPTKLERGIVTLYSNYTVCEKGQVLTPEQAKILKLVLNPMAKFRINIECCVTKENGYETFKSKRNTKKSPMKAKDKKKLKKAGKTIKDDSEQSDDDYDDDEEEMEVEDSD